MKIATLKDVDLTKYKIAYAYTSIMSSYDKTHNEVMALHDNPPAGYFEKETVVIALIPADKKLTECGGDDWDDRGAQNNASGFYKYPKGTIFLSGDLGGQLMLEEKEGVAS